MKQKISGEERRLLNDVNNRGVPLDGEVLKDFDIGSRHVEIYQISAIGTSACDLDSGGVGYALDVAIYNGSPKVIRLNEFHLKLPWPEPKFEWSKKLSKRELWKFGYHLPPPGIQGLEPEVVINHRMTEPIKSGGVLEGFLLGVGESPIPASHRDLRHVMMQFSVIDDLGDSYASDLRVEICSLKTTNQMRKEGKRIPGLLLSVRHDF